MMERVLNGGEEICKDNVDSPGNSSFCVKFLNLRIFEKKKKRKRNVYS